MNELNKYIHGNLQSPVWAAMLSLLVLWSAAAGIGRLLLRERNCSFAGTALGTIAMALAGSLLPLDLLPGWLSLAVLLPFSLYGAMGCAALHRIFPAGLWIILSVVALFTLGSALFPPYSWDEQVYQIALPIGYLRNGGAFFRPDNPYSAFASLPQFFMMWGVKTGGINLFRLTVWVISLMIPAVLWMRLRRYGDFYSITAVAAMVLSPLWTGCGRSFYQEWFIALYAFAGVLSLLSAEESRRSIVLAGVFTGGAVAVKLTAGGVALALVVLLCRERDLRRIGTFVAAAAVTAVIFYLRPWIFSGDPCYPFGALLFKDLFPAAQGAVAEYHHALGSYRFGLDGIPGVALGWIFAAFDGKIFDGAVAGWQFPLTILICIGALLAVYRRRDRGEGENKFAIRIYGTAAGFSAYLFWALSSQQVRFLLPLLPLAAWGTAAALPEFGKKWGKIVAIVLLAVTAAGISPVDFRHYYIAWKNLPGARSNPAGHLAAVSRDPGYFMMAEELAKLPAESRILLLFERRTLYLPSSCLVLGDSGFQEKIFTPPPETVEDFLAGLKDFDYLLAGGSPVEVDYLEKYEPWRELMRSNLARSVHGGRLQPVERIGEYWLFKINH